MYWGIKLVFFGEYGSFLFLWYYVVCEDFYYGGGEDVVWRDFVGVFGDVFVFVEFLCYFDFYYCGVGGVVGDFWCVVCFWVFG